MQLVFIFLMTMYLGTQCDINDRQIFYLVVRGCIILSVHLKKCTKKYEHVQDNLTPKNDVLEIFTKHRYLVDGIAIAQCYAPSLFHGEVSTSILDPHFASN